MRDILDKVDQSGDQLTAEAFNTNLADELQQIPESADFTLDPEAGPDTDTSMLVKSLVIYSAASNYYDDTGAANAFVLVRSGNLQPWPEYKDGMTVLFKALNTNTGACTINIDSLGAKSLTTSAGVALSSGDITTNDYVTARYDAGNDRFEMVVAPVTGGGGALTSWEENANDLRPITTKTGGLGDSTHLIENLYIMDSGNIYLGDAQDASIAFDSTDLAITGSGDLLYNTNIVYHAGNDSGLVHIAGPETITGTKTITNNIPFYIGSISLDGSIRFYYNSTAEVFTITPYASSAPITTRQISFTASINEWDIEGTPTINSNTILHSGNFDIDDYLPSQATHAGEFLTTDGAGTLSWAAVSGTLSAWEENGTTLRPTTSGYDLGDTTHLIGDAYFGDSGTIYLGTDHDMALYHDGVDGYISCTTGVLYGTGITTGFILDNNVRFMCKSTGGTPINVGFINSLDTIVLGNAALPVSLNSDGDINIVSSNIHLDDSFIAYFGSGDDMEIYHDGSNGYIDCGTGQVFLASTDIVLDNNHRFMSKNFAGTAYAIGKIDASDICHIANGTTGTQINSSGNVIINNSNLILDNNYLIQIEDSGATARTVLTVDGSDICYLSNTAFTTNIRSNGTLQYNGTTLASGSIDTTSSQTITVVDGLITAIA